MKTLEISFDKTNGPHYLHGSQIMKVAVDGEDCVNLTSVDINIKVSPDGALTANGFLLDSLTITTEE